MTAMTIEAEAVRTLVVWCPDWPLVAAGIPADVPAAVLHANRVLAATTAARSDGVRRGMRRREAQGRCPDLVMLTSDPARDARTFEPVVAAVERFTPRVELTRPGMCALAARGPSRYFGGEEVLVSRVAVAVDVVLTTILPGAPPSRVGVADGLFAAGLAARQGRVVPPGGSAAFLAPIPVHFLDLPELADLLVRLGLPTLGAFARLPPKDVEARFGPQGLHAHRLARGFDDRALDVRDAPSDLAATIELDPPLERADTAAFAAKAAADGLFQQLADSGLSCTCIRIESQTDHGEHLQRVWRHHRAFTARAVADRVRWQLDGWLTQRTVCRCPVAAPGQPVCPGPPLCPEPEGGISGGLTLLRLVLDEVVPDSGRQQGFWGGDGPADERAGRGLAHVQALLGPERVLSAIVGGGRGPGERVHFVPWGDPRQPDGPIRGTHRRRVRGTRAGTVGPRVSEVPVWPGRVPNPAPALVHRVPPLAEVADHDGQPVGVSGRGLLTAQPSRISIAGGPWVAIETWAGPWPADLRWWDPTVRRRLARLQVVTVAGAAYLLVLESGRWAIEATYD